MVCPFFAFYGGKINRMPKNGFYRILHRLHSFLVNVIVLLGFLMIGLFLAGIRIYAVETGSMQPAIPINSICFVNQNTAYETISIGDVIVFRKGGNATVTHRVVRITADGIVTKGDANNTEDSSLVTEENYIGKLIYFIPKIGIAVRFIRTPAGMGLAISVYLVLQILIFVLDSEQKPP